VFEGFFHIHGINAYKYNVFIDYSVTVTAAT
jgi:hypothetical protein